MRVDFKIVSYHRLSPEQVSDFSVEENAVFGRSNASDWCLPDPEKVVSGSHLKIEKEADGFYVHDTSTNGVFINRSVEPLGNHSKHHLCNGDLLSIGDYEIAVEIKDDVQKVSQNDKELIKSPTSSHVKIPDSIQNEPVEFLAQDLLADDKLTALPSINNDLNDNFVAPKSTSTSAIPEEWDFNLLDDDELTTSEEKEDLLEEPSAIVEAKLVIDKEPSAIVEEELVIDKEPSAIVEEKLVIDKEPSAIVEEELVIDKESSTIVEEESIFVKKPLAIVEEESFIIEESPVVLEEPIEAPDLHVVEPVAIRKTAITNINTADIALGDVHNSVEDNPSAKSTIPPTIKAAYIAPKQAMRNEKNVTIPNKKIVNASKVENTTNNDLSMFFKGLGLSDNVNTDLISEDVIFELGQSMNLMFMGLIKLLRHRASLKSEFKINQTTFQPQENNPLKFSATIDDVFNNLFLHGGSSFLSSEMAIKSAFNDTEKHDKALSAGNMGALLGVLNQLAPEQINLKNNQDHYFDKLIRANKHARNWDLYTQLHDDLKNEISTHGSSALTDEFVKAYDEKIKSL
ncbi:type VI secretion system-associated FHA domain protein TagH [Psychromonas sp. SP041]|uniref:type VI secretion system-associated FHA domain protein TagH n=1 Tax=Psychromonas sp. SP041 TaxID=1365007 RepID=UPI000429E530|nr:type VI secretion system-associated FHA domain protein TagH [Psychromonas sp. SP041]